MYAFQLCPDGGDVTIHSLGMNGFGDFGVEKVELLGCKDEISYTRDDDGMHIRMPQKVDIAHPICFRVHLM